MVEGHIGQHLCSRRKRPDVELTDCAGVNYGLQLVSLVVELNHHFVDRDVFQPVPPVGYMSASGPYREWSSDIN